MSLLKSPPSLIAHADWSCNPGKRWIAVARREISTYVLEVPRPVGELSSLLSRLSSAARSGTVLIGLDFPIGLPFAYARAAGIDRFKDVLPRLDKGEWSSFYELAEKPSDIGIFRPFYPARPGGTAHADLVAALGVTGIDDLRRICERRTPDRGNACSLFWTLGANQVGRAAISGWREILTPAISQRMRSVGLWPFDGALSELLASKDIVVVETYPAEACLHLGMTAPGRTWSKRKRADRLAQAERLQTCARELGLELTPDLAASIADGFGAAKDAEDKFDAVVGVLSMLSVVLGARDEGMPTARDVRTVEGWIFGQHANGSKSLSSASASSGQPLSSRMPV